jgi:hypothetical protein
LGGQVRDEDRRLVMQAVRYRVGTTYWSLLDINLMLRWLAQAPLA